MKSKLLFVILSIFLLCGCNNVNNEEVINKEEKTIKKDYIELTIVGDLLFESPFYNAVNNGYDKNNYFSLVNDYFTSDDISIGNMEVVIGNDNLKVSGDGYNFCAPSYIGDLVNTLDFEVLGTANNHTFDRGLDGITSTLDYFKNNTDITTVGTYYSSEDRMQERIIEIDNIKFGFLAYTYGTNQPNGASEQIGLLTDLDKVKEEIRNLKEKSDYVIVIAHWGKEFTFTPNDSQLELAKFFNEQKVDIVIGSHSHSIEPIDIIGDDYKTLVFYSLGNFTSQDDDIARTPKGQETFDNAYQFGLLSKVKISKDNLSIESVKTIPIVNYFDTNLNNFLLIPYEKYSEEYEINHYRYSYGLTKEFINDTFVKVIDSNYR